MMSLEKQNRVKAFKGTDDRKRSVAGEMLARKLLSEYCRISEEQIVFKTGEHGKPYAVGCAEFNISHSGNMVVCAVADNPVGIDVEMIKPINPGIVRKLCTESDNRYIYGKNSPNETDEFSDEQLYRFYEVWTAKEAYFKCIGTGIKNLKSISFENLIDIRKVFNCGDYLITIIEK